MLRWLLRRSALQQTPSSATVPTPARRSARHCRCAVSMPHWACLMGGSKGKGKGRGKQAQRLAAAVDDVDWLGIGGYLAPRSSGLAHTDADIIEALEEGLSIVPEDSGRIVLISGYPRSKPQLEWLVQRHGLPRFAIFLQDVATAMHDAKEAAPLAELIGGAETATNVLFTQSLLLWQTQLFLPRQALDKHKLITQEKGGLFLQARSSRWTLGRTGRILKSTRSCVRLQNLRH